MARVHHRRRVDFRKTKRLGHQDGLTVWKKTLRCPPFLDAAQWEEVPAQITVRLIRFTATIRGQRSRRITLVASLLDRGLYPDQELIALYARRWRLELCFRDLKTTQGMERLHCKTPVMLEKELLAVLIALVPDRPHRQEPRALKRRLQCYPLLTKPRRSYREILHRNRYRKGKRRNLQALNEVPFEPVTLFARCWSLCFLARLARSGYSEAVWKPAVEHSQSRCSLRKPSHTAVCPEEERHTQPMPCMKTASTLSFGAATLLALLMAGSFDARAVEWFVSTSGDDAHPGTRTEPFATPQRAMLAVRQVVAAGLQEDVHVTFAAGTYELAAPLVFTPADSGTADHSITYAAGRGQAVVFSGGRRIRGWHDEGGRWTARLDGVRSGNWFFRLLVVNDERATRARWPDSDGTLRLADVSADTRSFTFDRPLPGPDLAGQDAELVVYENWSISRALITAVRDGRVETANPVGWIGHGPATTASPGKPAFIEHARLALDRPGEWWLDRQTGELAYLPRNGERPGTIDAVAPTLSQLVQIAGTKDRPVRNLRFEGLRFEHADFALPSFGYSEIQAAHYGPSTNEPTHVQPVAIECAYAEDVRFEACRFAHLNASGIGFGPGCRHNVISRCTVEDIGDNGIMIGWRGQGRLQAGAEGRLDADWADPGDVPVGNEVVNCVVRRCGADSRGGVGIFVAFSADTRIAHNEVYDLPYTGISVGYRWNPTPTSQVRCRVDFNHIHQVMQQLADGGGIYTLGFQPGTVLRGNLIHDVPRSAYAHGGAPNNGFFIDEGSKGFLFESNVVHATSGRSVRFNQNQPEGHTWRANAFDEATTPDVIAEAAKRAGPTAFGPPFACTDYTAGRVCLVSTTGRIEWEYPAPSANDLWVLPNGNLLFNTGHGVREVTRAKEVVFDYQSTSEIYACQRLPDGNTFIGECNAGRLLEVAPNGKVVKEVRLLPDGRDGGHAYMRNARRLENGHYLVAHYGEQVVREYDAAGNAVMAIAANGGPHSAIRLSNGHTLISCGDMPGGSRVFEVDSSGKVVWQIQGDELPGISLKFVAGLQRLPHGNTVLCNWLGHGQFGRAPHLIEVTPDKRVVWTFADHLGFRTVSSVQRLDLPRDAAPWQLAH